MTSKNISQKKVLPPDWRRTQLRPSLIKFWCKIGFWLTIGLIILSLCIIVSLLLSESSSPAIVTIIETIEYLLHVLYLNPWPFVNSFAPLIFGITVFIILTGARILITDKEIIQFNLITRVYNRLLLNDINTVKCIKYSVTRNFDIKTIGNKGVLLPSFLYNIKALHSQVRENAGDDHPLTMALEKELSRKPKTALKVWLLMGLIGLNLIVSLIGLDLVATQTGKPLEAEIASYVQKHPKTAPNQSAIELQALMAKIGLSMEKFGDGSTIKVKPEKAAILESKEIRKILEEYLDRQLDKSEESIEPVPQKISSYLKKHSEEIKSHLISHPIAKWGADPSFLTSHNPVDLKDFLQAIPDLRVLAIVENLLIIDIFDKRDLGRPEIRENLVAIVKAQQSLRSYPLLVSQMVFTIQRNKISKLARKIDTIFTAWNNSWEDNLILNPTELNHHNMMVETINSSTYIVTRIIQNPQLPNESLMADIIGRWNWVYRHRNSPRSYWKLVAIDYHRQAQRFLTYWQKENICRVNEEPLIFKRSPIHQMSASPYEIAENYKSTIISDLLWELTSGVKEVKSKLSKGQDIAQVAQDFNLNSQACAGEKWTAKIDGRSIEISLSHLPNKIIDADTIAQLTYKISPAK
jgi:hypothetical protein